ncbi:MAG: endolytic transglycosylase MltG [Alphaproteobacteria bacterium]|nr:endolytic transglycosylase MltG [Alphaproteobacteria bacterium]
MNKAVEPTRVPEPKRQKRRRSAFSRVVLSLFILVFLGGLAAAVAAFYAYQEYTLPGPLAENKIFAIDKGMSAADIGTKLEDAGIISDARVFSAMAYVSGARSRLRAGEYEFVANATMRDVMTLIASGKSITYKLTIPEGWTSEMAANRINANEILVGEPVPVPAEGAIMPDTYVFKRGMTRQKLLTDMQAAQQKLLDQIWATRSPVLAIDSMEQAVVLASIVEKETAKGDERPLIASVFMNRLKRGMRLQSDPTIIYGIAGGKGKLDRPLTRADIRNPTPYNTYTIDGLPPGPIANPGRAALEAVVSPPDTDYLYFVADGSGGHTFAETLEDHNQNVAKWRKLSKDAVTAAAEDSATPQTAAPDGMQGATAVPQDSAPQSATAGPSAPAPAEQAQQLPSIEPPAPAPDDIANEPGEPLAPSETAPDTAGPDSAARPLADLSASGPVSSEAEPPAASAAPAPAATAAEPAGVADTAPAQPESAAANTGTAPVPIPQQKPRKPSPPPQAANVLRAGDVVKVGETLTIIPKPKPAR